MNPIKMTFTITQEHSGQRLDKALPSLKEINSRSQATKLFECNLVTLDGNPVKPSHLCAVGESFQIEIPQRTEINLSPYEFQLDIIYEDNDLLVINKPAGIVMHPSLGHEQKSIVNALIHMKISLSMGFNEQRPGIVHRLDKDTSGLVVVAKNNHTHAGLSQQFQDRTVKRSYWAIVWGYPQILSQTIESHLQRHPKNRKKYSSSKTNSQGKKAITDFLVLKNYLKKISLLQCQLGTGRTHQIRVHLSELHLPIVGDELYGNDKRAIKISSEILSTIQNIHRLGLHAFELGFTHPTHKKQLHFKVDWPKDLKSLVNLLNFTQG